MWLIVSHGTSEDCTTAIAGAQHLATRTGAVVVLYEYPGYGESAAATPGAIEEEPSEAGVYAAARAVYAFVTADCHVPVDRVVVMGWSIGSGPTLELAATRVVAGVIVQSPFRSVIRTRCCTPWSLSCDIFRNEDNARRVPRNVRVLVMHGRRDAVVPVKHGEFLQTIFETRGNAPRGSLWAPNCGHTQLALERDYVAAIRAFLLTVRDNASGIQPQHSAAASAHVAVRLASAFPSAGTTTKEA
jgi:pimeloyl-ACP methyl ester carboxylesterase